MICSCISPHSRAASKPRASAGCSLLRASPTQTRRPHPCGAHRARRNTCIQAYHRDAKQYRARRSRQGADRANQGRARDGRTRWRRLCISTARHTERSTGACPCTCSGAGRLTCPSSSCTCRRQPVQLWWAHTLSTTELLRQRPVRAAASSRHADGWRPRRRALQGSLVPMRSPSQSGSRALRVFRLH